LRNYQYWKNFIADILIMIECEFKIRDLASLDHYSIHKHGERWWIFNRDGEGVEIDPDALFSMVDKYFKENV
jgi:hypothetical protein